MSAVRRALLPLAAALLLLVALAGLAWLTHTVLAHERRARLAEHARLACWRLDGRLAALVTAAAARPPDVWTRGGDVSPILSRNSSEVTRVENSFRALANERDQVQSVALNSIAQQQVQLGLAEGLEPPRLEWSAEGTLRLTRRAVLRGRPVDQDADLDWARLSAELAAEVRDLLPAARIERQDGPPDAYTLALAPLHLVPGDVLPADSAPDPTLRTALLAAWAGTLLAVAALAAAAWAALRLAARRAAFVSAVTHELRTPLTALRLHLDLLPEPTGADDPVAHLRRGALRLQHLVDNVLAYAGLEHRPPCPAPLALDALLADLRPTLAARLAEAGLRLETAVPPGLMVHADAAAVTRILLNLVDNAAKYAASAASGDPLVDLTATTVGTGVELSLRDHGPGIAPAVAGRLFRPFSRHSAEAAGGPPGVGLGLALARRLARAQGGDLRWDRAVAPGACLVLTLRPAAGGGTRA